MENRPSTRQLNQPATEAAQSKLQQDYKKDKVEGKKRKERKEKEEKKKRKKEKRRRERAKQHPKPPSSQAATWAAQGYIPAADFNRIVQSMGYPGVGPALPQAPQGGFGCGGRYCGC